MCRILALGLTLIAISGCVDLTAVSNFAKSGANATSGTDVLTGYQNAEDTAVRYAYPPTDHPSKEQIQTKADDAAAAAAAKDKITAAQNGLKVLSAYLAVMGKLSDSGLINTKEATSSITASVTKVDAKFSGMSSAASDLLQLLIDLPLELKREDAIKKLVKDGNTNIQALCEEEGQFAQAISVAWLSDVTAANAYYGTLEAAAAGQQVPGIYVQLPSEKPLSETPTERLSLIGMGTATLIDANRRQEIATFSTNSQKALALQTALKAVEKGQAALFANIDDFNASALIANLSAYQTQIEGVAQVIAK